MHRGAQFGNSGHKGHIGHSVHTGFSVTVFGCGPVCLVPKKEWFLVRMSLNTDRRVVVSKFQFAHRTVLKSEPFESNKDVWGHGYAPTICVNCA